MYLESWRDFKNIKNRKERAQSEGGGDCAWFSLSLLVEAVSEVEEENIFWKMNVSSCEKLSLKWNEHESNLLMSVVDSHRNNEFCDVTLLSEDLAHIPAHKLILSGSSGFFHAILRKFPSDSHPLIYLKGVKQRNLNDILSFIYTGEAGVRQEDLNNFLEVASELKIKGLTQQNPGRSKESTKVSDISSPKCEPKKFCSNKFHTENKKADQQNETQEEKMENIPESADQNYDTSEKQIKEKFSCIMSVGNGYSLAWRCQLCQRIFSSKKVAVGHVESEHEN